MRADRRQLRASARRPFAVALLSVVTGVALSLGAAPAQAALTLKTHPHPDAAAVTPKSHGHGHPHHAAPAPHGGKHKSLSGSVITPHTATKAAPVAPVAPATRPSYVQSIQPADPAPPAATSASSKTKPTSSAEAASGGGAADSAWQRKDEDNADRGVVRAFAADLQTAGQSAGFPALLVAVMVVFLLVQHRLDRRDVKLSHADWVSDQGLEFSAPATTRR